MSIGKKRLLGIVALVIGVVALMVLFDIGILWLFAKVVQMIWGWGLWAAESLYWALTSLFEVRDRSMVP